MNFFSLMGAIIVIVGGINLKRYIQRYHWPVVDGTFDDVDVKIEGTVMPEAGFSIQPKYIQKFRYTYRGIRYVTEVAEYEIKTEVRKLRINPDKPSEAYLDNVTLLFPVVSICFGIILILVSINVGSNGPE
jgi:hypothetical protein